MKNIRILLLIGIAVVALAHRSDGQQTRPVAEQLRLAGITPRGALVYVQATDLSALMKMWNASNIREQYYKSASFSAYSQSHIYLKLQNRKQDFEQAIGFGLDEDRLAELAGGASSVAMYDIGKLEMVFVTEVPRARAIATTMFKQVPQFQERSADGSPYYVHDVKTDNGNLNQQFCFAYSEGKLIVTTAEGLMIRALRNAKQTGDDALLPDLLSIAGQAEGFAARDITIWLDQARLNKNLYFNNYWIHHNTTETDPSSLANIESGLIDVRFTPQGLNEQRWFKMSSANANEAGTLSAEQTSALIRFAPADAQLIEAHAPSGAIEELGHSVSQIFFGKLPDSAGTPPDIPDRTRETNNEGDSSARTERYARLDARFDRDVDDPAAEGAASKGPGAGGAGAGVTFEKSLVSILSGVSPSGYCEMVRSKADAGKSFVGFERAIVLEMRADAAIDRATFERAITDEIRARFVISGVDPNLSWQEEAGVRYLAESLLQQSAAYSISGKYLVMASSKEFARDIMQAAKTSAPPAKADFEGTATFYAVARVAEARPIFDRLMAKLDGKVENAPASTDQQDETETEVKFFSDNLSSLIGASSIRELRLKRETSGPLMTERVTYLF